ncbi:bifunctional metallophosphatase/5'-nucleotidase [Virgibacillus salarius]
MKENIYFYYTNDLHSNFDQWSRVTGYLKETRDSRRKLGCSCWAVDIGDHVDRVHPISDAFMGKANVQLMNEAGYDVVTLGNNEGITLSHQDLFHLYDEADFEIVCANLHSSDQIEPAWLQQSTILQSAHGVNIGVIGLTAPFNAFYQLLDWYVSPPFEQLQQVIDNVKKQADIVVLLSHLGYSEDQEIAKNFPDIDVIIGGHTHHLLRNGEYVNNTLITAAGKHCHYVGEVILTWDHDEHKLSRKEAYALNITHLPKDKTTERRIEQLSKQATTILAKPIIELAYPLEVNWFQSTPILQALTESIKKQTEADCAMLNAGLLLEGLPAGKVTYGDVHRICPHPINTCVVKLNGDELLEVIRASQTKEFMQLQLKGFGFRGKVLGKMAFAGLEMDMEELKNGEYFVKQAFLGSYPLDPEKTYTVATADTFTFGRLLPEVAKSEIKQYYLPEFLRDILVYTLKEGFKD